METIKLFLPGILAGILALIWGGCTIKNKGTARENEPPKVFFSAIPLPSTLFTAPGQLFWYSTDRDGYIVEFQYALIPEALVGVNQVPPAQQDSVIRAFLSARPPDGDTVVWHWTVVSNILHNGQTDTVALPAARDSITILNTVVFVRSRDDKGALSTDAFAKGATPQEREALLRLHPNAIAWRNFRRRNRPPTATFDGVRVANQPIRVASQLPQLTFYSLPDSTYDPAPTMRIGHLGITLLWHGTDFPDYPILNQPKFTYFWELFGPFAGGAADFVRQDSSRLWASTDQPVRYVGPQGSSGPRFDSATSATFYGLRGMSPLGYTDSTSPDTNLRPAFYSFRVRARDDAGVASRAVLATIKVVRPRFDRKILVIYKKGEEEFFGSAKDASPPVQDSMLIQKFYSRLIRRAGYGNSTDPNLFDSTRDMKYFYFSDNIPESLLARYKLVIYHKETFYPQSFNTAFLASLKAYMDVGGSVWGLGRDDLCDLTGLSGTQGPTIFGYTTSDPIIGLPHFYFGADGMFTHNHLNTVSGLDLDSVSLEEFVGAEPLLGTDPRLPFLDIDTNVIQSYVVSRDRKDTSSYRRMPAVNYFNPSPAGVQGRLYLFRSDSTEGIKDTSHLNGKLVAFRADRVRFKTSFFGFSLYGIMEDQAVCLMRRMLEWFLPNANPSPPQASCP